MVDLHCHILPGIDDGAKDWEMSTQMVRMAAADGVRQIVATPHSNDEYRYDRSKFAEVLAELRGRTNNLIKLSLGCDFNFSFENIEAALHDPSIFCIDGSPYLLVEFSEFGIPPTTLEALERLRERGIVPIITHPERNRLLEGNQKLLRPMTDLGCIIQITANSLTGFWGERARKFCFTLLDKGMVSVVASDGHNLKQRPPILSEARRLLRKKYSEETANALCSLNPAAIVAGKPVAQLWGQGAD
jgi:protein-tyrosine phosphatase